MAKKDSTDVFMTELDAYLFGEGTHYEIYNKMGAHKAVKDGQEGVYFAVWAPHAKDIFVVGDFNDWKAYGYDTGIRRRHIRIVYTGCKGWSDVQVLNCDTAGRSNL